MKEPYFKKCRVCEKALKVEYEKSRINYHCHNVGAYSDDGVLFEKAWFCNACWKLMLGEEV